MSQEDESNYDAYIIVFSVTDRSSFDVAAFLLRHLRVEVGTDRAIIVVANKVDLVRQRRVTNSGQYWTLLMVTLCVWRRSRSVLGDIDVSLGDRSPHPTDVKSDKSLAAPTCLERFFSHTRVRSTWPLR